MSWWKMERQNAMMVAMVDERCMCVGDVCLVAYKGDMCTEARVQRNGPSVNVWAGSSYRRDAENNHQSPSRIVNAAQQTTMKGGSGFYALSKA